MPLIKPRKGKKKKEREKEGGGSKDDQEGIHGGMKNYKIVTLQPHSLAKLVAS